VILQIKEDRHKGNQSHKFLTVCLHDDIHQSDDKRNEIVLKKPCELEYNALFLGATQWRPKYDVLYKKDECCIVMEIPGNTDLQVNDEQAEQSARKIIFSGNRQKEKFYSSEASSDHSENVWDTGNHERQFGPFEFVVHIPQAYSERKSYGQKNGVYWVTMAKPAKKAAMVFENNNDEDEKDYKH